MLGREADVRSYGYGGSDYMDGLPATGVVVMSRPGLLPVATSGSMALTFP